ncbi:MAG: Crp/Fnr family transcriptional regulator [Rhodocyclales bacterium]|jgi:CRP-like cAMP-binding protein|nr:Crp/Fnr family transcriptional regulator [Rhodocyclales bacterium]
MNADLPDYVPESLRALARTVSLKRKQSLFRFDDAVQSLFFVRQGEMEAVRYSADGEAMVMVRASGGEFFGEPALAVDRYTCAAHARVSSELLALPKAAVLAAFQADPGFATAFLLAQVRNARRQCSRYERVRLRRAEDRIVHYLICEAGPDGRVVLAGSLADWAGELGLQPESLYRALARLREEGRIEGEGTNLHVR